MDGEDTLFLHLATGKDEGSPLLATSYPNHFYVLDPKSGAVLRQGALEGYEKWTEHNALLYTYPYVFSGARRAASKGFAYDIIALNLRTGEVDWTYAIGTQKEKFSTASNEILNFVESGGNIYISRADGTIMAFRARE